MMGKHLNNLRLTSNSLSSSEEKLQKYDWETS